VLGHWPSDSASLEGMGLRIHDMDAVLGPEKRIYVQLKSRSFLPWPETKVSSPERDYIWLSPKNPFHVLKLLYLLSKARLIYAHSVLNLSSFWIRHFLRSSSDKKLILDVHGVVPEEFSYTGDAEAAENFSKVEQECLSKCLALVHVTSRMQQHLTTKYPGISCEHFVIPTDTALQAPPQEALLAAKQPTILYAGGTQKWQLFNETLDLFRRVPATWRKLLLTYDLTTARSKISSRGLAIECAHKSGPDLAIDFTEAQLGIVLREDSLVNRVACPTKLVDYLKFGIAPVVQSQEIGDFAEFGCPFVSATNIEAYFTDHAVQREISAQALASYARLVLARKQGITRLKSFLKTSAN
jgi:hypothetical protein